MKTLSRRAFLGAVALGAAGCSTVIDNYTQPDIPAKLQPPGGGERHPIAHLLNRAAFGVRPGEIEAITDREKWLERQLDYESIDDEALELRLRRYDTLKLDAPDLMSFSGTPNRRLVRDQLAVMTLLRAVYSRRQLYEVMVGFWSDHFNLYHFKGDVSLLKTVDDREVIRPHALGKFGDLLRASAASPAMLLYLDNVLNEKSHPNENYAREVMELHTLGVMGGYTEQDIKEVARCFTGWSVDEGGRFKFIPEWHDMGEKTVLGHTIRADNPQEDGDRVLDILLAHPSTPRFVGTKLVRRLVADDPPSDLVEAVAQTWTASEGDIRAILRTIFTHHAFEAAPPKLKRPLELLASLLRATNARCDGDPASITTLEWLGQRPFGWTTPDGYPDTADAWSVGLLGRWNMCLDVLDGRLEGVRLDDLDEIAAAGDAHSAAEKCAFFGRLFLSRDLRPDEATLLGQYGERDMLALLAASPAFQWR